MSIPLATKVGAMFLVYFPELKIIMMAIGFADAATQTNSTANAIATLMRPPFSLPRSARGAHICQHPVLGSAGAAAPRTSDQTIPTAPPPAWVLPGVCSRQTKADYLPATFHRGNVAHMQATGHPARRSQVSPPRLCGRDNDRDLKSPRFPPKGRSTRHRYCACWIPDRRPAVTNGSRCSRSPRSHPHLAPPVELPGPHARRRCVPSGSSQTTGPPPRRP